MGKAEQARQFDQCLMKASRSPAFARFCERAYGMHLGQFSTCDMEQLEALFEALVLREGDSVLDVGCGLGMISEYISDRTGAHVTGIDYAAGAIEDATRRTEGKSNRLRFETADMETVELPAKAFDAVIALDTVYFATGITALLERLKQAVKQGGQMVIYHSQMIAPGGSTDLLQPDRTPLAVALSAVGFSYTCRDLTENDLRFWARSKQAAEDLQPEFDVEGVSTLCSGRVGESNAVLDLAAQGNFRRFMYHARLET